MVAYAAPLADMRFVLERVVGLDRIAGLPGYEAASADVVGAVLEEAGRLAAEVIAPLNRVGDREGAVLERGAVRTASGFRAAYQHYVDGGWNSVPFDPAYGGQGLPWALTFALQEMWQSASMAFALCPLLTQGAVELLSAHGSAEQRALYLPRLISGEWTGAMDLTEPQAGSDLSAVQARAEPVGDGVGYRIRGQKIFITYGDHDLSANIVHMVLARLPGAPEGVRGISLFLVPKRLPNPDGTPGPLNDLRCTGLEHKLGIHGSPTAVMSYGDSGGDPWGDSGGDSGGEGGGEGTAGAGALGTLVGAPNRGLEAMFTMMNNARLSVGIQGLAIAERAYQQALSYARARVQSRDIGDPAGPRVPILRHPDVRRQFLTMRAGIEAMRALAYEAGAALDHARADPDAAAARAAQERVDLLTPVVKGWSTDLGFELASLGVQVHGGMGYIEETGAAQHLRDARIASIYEGTNGIQANDLVFRKVGRDRGAGAFALIAALRAVAERLREKGTAGSGCGADYGVESGIIAGALLRGLAALEETTRWVAAAAVGDARAAAAGASPYLRLFGTVAGGGMMARSALAALEALGEPGVDRRFMVAKLATARFYAETLLPQAEALVPAVIDGHAVVNGFPEDDF